MPDVFVGLGSNVEPVRHLVSAVANLESAFGSLRSSSVYRSPAYGMAGPDFLNLVVTFQVAVNADEVETVLSALEANSGRIPTPKIASRTLDLDLLIFGCGVNPAQRLPREDILRYPFVLAPLNDLSPELIHPVTGLSMQANWLRMAAAGHPLECVGTIGQL